MRDRIAKIRTSSVSEGEGVGVRLDIWLWATRFFKTRAAAKQAIESGNVHIDEKAIRASMSVRIGDRMTVQRGEERFEIEATGLIARRVAPAIARANYRESESSIAARELCAEQRRMARAGYQRPPTKPDKRARRLIKALGDIEML